MPYSTPIAVMYALMALTSFPNSSVVSKPNRSASIDTAVPTVISQNRGGRVTAARSRDANGAKSWKVSVSGIGARVLGSGFSALQPDHRDDTAPGARRPEDLLRCRRPVPQP